LRLKTYGYDGLGDLENGDVVGLGGDGSNQVGVVGGADGAEGDFALVDERNLDEALLLDGET